MAITDTSDTTGTSDTTESSDGCRDSSAARRGEWWGDNSARAVAGSVVMAVGAAALLGVALGLGWSVLAPTVRVAVSAEGFRLTSEAEAGRIFAAEGVFALLMMATGALAALAGRRWVVATGPLAVVALAVCGVLGSVVAWRVGAWAGPDALVPPVGSAADQLRELPLGLRSKGLLLIWPIATTFVTMWIAVLTVVGSAPDGSPGIEPAQQEVGRRTAAPAG